MASAQQSVDQTPLTRQEYFNVMVHFYRGESHRAMIWRQRLDTTTNWAVLTTAGVLSFSFADRTHEPIILLLSSLIILAYLFIEARRFRYFEVYRARVRMLEENFLIPIITQESHPSQDSWRAMVAMDLDLPKFKTTLLEAVGFRLRRNYLFIFLILLGAWFVKLMMHPNYAASLAEIYQRMAVGWVASWAILIVQLVFFVSLVGLVIYARRKQGGMPDDEIAGVEPDLERWN